MNVKPILFNTEMVKAILEGRKTQTRRPMKEQPKYGANPCPWVKSGWALTNKDGMTCCCSEVKPPYQVGDVLYVRETWGSGDTYSIDYDYGRTYYGTDGCVYKADDPTARDKWHPSIHMPREYARLFLEVTDVSAERVQSISEKDAKAEGILSDAEYRDKATEYFPCPICKGAQLHGALGSGLGYMEVECESCEHILQRYQIIWDSIYAKQGLGWDVNPWVWVHEFRVIDKPEGWNDGI